MYYGCARVPSDLIRCILRFGLKCRASYVSLQVPIFDTSTLKVTINPNFFHESLHLFSHLRRDIMDSVQEQEAKKQKIEQETPQVEETEIAQEQEANKEPTTVEYDEEDIKLGNQLIAAVIANDLVSTALSSF